jgi:hypothetical protein
MTGSRPAVVLARLGVVERQSSHADDDDARLCFARTMAWPGLGLIFSAMQGDEVQKRVAEVAKALYPRTDETAVLIARAITRHSWSSPLMFGCRRRGAAPDRVNAEQRRYVSRVDGRMPTMTCTAVAVQQTVDRTPRAAFNRPI